MVLAPIVRGRKGEYGKQFEELRAEGFARVKVDGELRRLEEEIVLDKKFKHDIEVVVDRLVMQPDSRKRLADSVETAVALADGHRSRSSCVERRRRAAADVLASASPAWTAASRCPSSSRASFSFNSPHGACPRCTGLGSQMEIDPDLVVPDPSLSIGEGAIAPWAERARRTTTTSSRRRSPSATRSTSTTPWQDLPEEQQRPASSTAPTATAIYVTYRNRDRAQALVHDELRGHRPEPRAPLPGDRLRLGAREDRGVHDDAAVPGVQGRAAAARVARGEGRRDGDPRVHAR